MTEPIVSLKKLKEHPSLAKYVWIRRNKHPKDAVKLATKLLGKEN